MFGGAANASTHALAKTIAPDAAAPGNILCAELSTAKSTALAPSAGASGVGMRGDLSTSKPNAAGEPLSRKPGAGMRGKVLIAKSIAPVAGASGVGMRGDLST